VISLAEAKQIDTISQGDQFPEICVQSSAKRFESRFMTRGLLLTPYTGRLNLLKEVNQLVHVFIPEI